MSGTPNPPRTRGPIDEAWRSYLRIAVHPTAGIEQVLQTRIAFYAGAQAIFRAMQNGPNPGKKYQTDAEIQAHVDAMERELDEFTRGLKVD